MSIVLASIYCKFSRITCFLLLNKTTTRKIKPDTINLRKNTVRREERYANKYMEILLPTTLSLFFRFDNKSFTKIDFLAYLNIKGNFNLK